MDRRQTRVQDVIRTDYTALRCAAFLTFINTAFHFQCGPGAGRLNPTDLHKKLTPSAGGQQTFWGRCPDKPQQTCCGQDRLIYVNK